ncbi:MAG: c-type cytochrome, partial [Planctomycetaceae bacterium]
MYLDGQLLIDHDEQHELTEKQAVAQLQRGLHALTLTCSGNGVDDGLRLQWAGPGFDRQELPADVFVTRPPKTPQELAIDSLIRLPAGRSEQVRVLLQLLRSQRSVTTALYALTTIPSGDWPRESIPEIGQICINWLSSRPPAERNAIPADAVLALAKSVADRLQGRDQQIFVAALDTVCVPIVSLGTVAERMIYDREKLVAQAGRPLVLRLTNADNMPHNLVVVKPGSLTAVGELAEATGRDPDAAARQFIPESTEIIASGQLLQPGQTGDIFLDVPETEGIYPFVCTYPGHWRRMYGALYVVSDPLEFEENPTAWIAEHKLPIQDELLTLLDRNTDWKLSDLEPQIANLQQRENNFAVGRRIFSSATCASCHRLGSTGNTIGPDLANLPAEYRPLDVLDHILNPTKQIAEKYRSRVLVLDSGKVITGLVTSAADNHLMLLRNPATPNQLLRIERHQIKEMRFSKVSIMPEGILNKLNREEILDLLAFILAAGNETHPLFSAQHHHHE